MAEREGFEPSMELLTPYSLSRGAPSADSAISPLYSGARILGPVAKVKVWGENLTAIDRKLTLR